MTRAWSAAFLGAVAAASLAAPAIGATSDGAAGEPQGTAVERFVRMVGSGADVTNSEFGQALSAADVAKLQAMAHCTPGQPRTSDSGGSVLIMWDCPGQPANKGVGTMLSFADGKVTGIFMMGAVIVATGSR
jgi:hypothetical protein